MKMHHPTSESIQNSSINSTQRISEFTTQKGAAYTMPK